MSIESSSIYPQTPTVESQEMVAGLGAAMTETQQELVKLNQMYSEITVERISELDPDKKAVLNKVSEDLHGSILTLLKELKTAEEAMRELGYDVEGA